MKNNQYHKDLISEAEVKKNHWHNYSRIIKNLSQDTKHEMFWGKRRIGEKEEKATEEESQAN